MNCRALGIIAMVDNLVFTINNLLSQYKTTYNLDKTTSWWRSPFYLHQLSQVMFVISNALQVQNESNLLKVFLHGVISL